MTKIDIFSGFLGAGKTTLIKKLLKEALSDEKVVLIENEFGEIGIDGGFMKEAGIEVTEMNSGCICCSLVGDFGVALKKVIDQYHPDRILIEPSGVGKLSDVIRAVEGVEKDIDEAQMGSFVTVADAMKCRMYVKNFGEFFLNQIEYAGTILLSRTQKMSQAKLEAAVALLREHNDKARIITTPWDELTGAQILDAMQSDHSLAEEMLETVMHEHEHEHEHDEHCTCGCHDHDHEHHHHADEVFTSWGMETPRKFSQAEIQSLLDALADEQKYGAVLRAKGIVDASDGEWIYFDYVPGESDIRRGNPAVTGRFCVIGSGLKEDALKELFHIE